MIQQAETVQEKILVADNEYLIRRVLQTRLTKLGYVIFLATDGREALHLFNKEKPDLVVLDVFLPSLDGYNVCLKIREKANTPLILLTPLNKISDRIRGLELGADDCIMKPFSPKELEARIHSLLKRSSFQSQGLPTNKKSSLKIGNLLIDFNRHEVYKNQKLVKLTVIEFALLELLVEATGKKLSRTEILTNIWGYAPERYSDTRVVDVHVSRLRAKIEENPKKPDFILTSRGIGYTFQTY